jgi:hypothetical protein
VSRVHLLSACEPIKTWEGSKLALCGVEVPDARPVLTLNLASGELEAMSTLMLCKECLAGAMITVELRTWFYGIAPEQTALKINRGAEEA